MTDRVGQQFGDYRLIKNLGAGGFADVYLGEHIYLGTKAAVKVLKGAFAPKEIEQFRTEAQTIARLEHPHIVRVITFSVAKINTQDVPFLVLEYASNGTLRRRHPKGTRLPLETIVSYVKQVADALQYAHNQKIIHRDIKPENMLLGRHNEVLLSDFGIALTTPQTGTLTTQEMAGTVVYIAPEQIKGKPRPASDQYALGVTVYEWLSGERPFQGPPWEVVNKHIYAPPPPLREKVPTLSPAVEQVVLRTLAKEPQQRFPTVQEFATALEQASQEAARSPISSSVNPSVVPPASSLPTERAIPPTQVASPASQAAPKATPIPPTPVASPVPANQATAQSAQSTPSQYSYRPSTLPPIRANLWFIVVPMLVIVVLLVVYAALNGTRIVTTQPGTTSTTVTNPAALVTSNGTMFGFDLQRTRFNPNEHTLTSTNVSGLVPDWTFTTGGFVDSSPTVANGMVYVGSDDHRLYAFKASCGNTSCSPLWTAATGGIIRSSPAIANGMVYVGSDDHRLYAFKASGCGNASCSPLWTAATGDIIRSSPVVVNGIVYVGSQDGKLYAFNASTGKPLWTASTGGIIYYSSPAVSDGVVYVGSEDHQLYAFNASTGKLLWKASTGNSISSSPAVANGIVYVGSSDGKLYAFKISDCSSGSCSPFWTASTGAAITYSSPAVANGMVYIGSDDHNLYAFNATGCGQVSCPPVWMASAGNVVRSSPTVANGVVYVGSDDGKLYAFNAAGCGNASCAPLWMVSTAGHIFSSPALANGVVYVGSQDSKLYAFHLYS